MRTFVSIRAYHAEHAHEYILSASSGTSQWYWPAVLASGISKQWHSRKRHKALPVSSGVSEILVNLLRISWFPGGVRLMGSD